MAYTPHTWTDGPGGTPINATTLNEMEAGIDDADTRITTLIPYIPDNGNSAFAIGGVETNTRFNSNGSSGTSGRLWISYFTALANITVTKLAMNVPDVAAAGTTLARLALFTVVADDSVTKVAQTDSDNTIGGFTYTLYERALSTVGGFPSSYNLLAGTRYAMGYLQVATTMPTINGVYVHDQGGAPVPTRLIGGQTDIAASYAVANLPTANYAVWLRAKP